MSQHTPEPRKIDQDHGILAWHFVPDDGRLAHDKQRLKVKVGYTYSVPPPIVPCVWGLHGSADPLDAVKYANGALVCRVRLWGSVVAHNGDKIAAQHRDVLAMAHATRTIHLFAIECARRALIRERKAGREPDKRSWKALLVKRQWLDGRATDEELAAAWAAARAAACDVTNRAERAWQSRRLTALLTKLLEG